LSGVSHNCGIFHCNILDRMSKHSEQACDHVAAVKALNDQLRDAHDRKAVPWMIASLNAELGIALKLADVESNLAIVEELEAIRTSLVGNQRAAYTVNVHGEMPEGLAERVTANLRANGLTA
jgi:hypothetical protein